jgi:hypothetical protein
LFNFTKAKNLIKENIENMQLKTEFIQKQAKIKTLLLR